MAASPTGSNTMRRAPDDQVPELRTFVVGDDWVEIGAALTLSEVEEWLAGRIPLLAELFPQFASRLIRGGYRVFGLHFAPAVDALFEESTRICLRPPRAWSSATAGSPSRCSARRSAPTASRWTSASAGRSTRSGSARCPETRSTSVCARPPPPRTRSRRRSPCVTNVAGVWVAGDRVKAA